MSKKLLFSLFFLVSTSSAFADVVSLDSNYVAGQADITTKLNNDRVALANGINNIRGTFSGSPQTSGQIKAETIGEENMADDANPRIRTSEGASCPDLVYSGLLPSTTSGTLIGSVPAGVAYPDGYRVEKTGSTAKTFTASKWTYGYILTSGSLSYQEQTIGGTRPSDPANSAPLFRASSDGTQVISVQDLRKTSCAAGPFSSISDASGQATLADIFANGTPVRKYSPSGRTPQGWAQGAIVSWDSATTFKVTPGSLYINGKYRRISNEITVTQSADDPTQGGSGYDAGGAIPTSSTMYIYAVADQEDAPGFSVSYSTSASSPSGITNYRLIGSTKTDATSLFTSQDVNTVHSISGKETAGGWVNFNGTGTVAIKDAYNVSGITDNGTGDYTVAWDVDYATANYATSGSCYVSGSSLYWVNPGSTAPTAGAYRSQCNAVGGAATDASSVSVISFGDQRQ